MKHWTMMVAVLAMLVVSGAALANDGMTEDPRENACYAGGTLEGKCDWPTDAEDEWAWNCGWYLAAYQNGRASADSLPETCAILISQAPSCYFTTAVVDFDFALSAPLNTFLNAVGYLSTDGSCSGGVHGVATIVEVATMGEAQAACAAISPVYTFAIWLEYYDNTPDTWYRCAF